jgi:hypothetical protein
MNNFKRAISAVIIGILFVIASVALGQAQEKPGNPDYKWLNGKWQGVWESPKTDGTFIMNLQVVNDNQIKGSGVVRRSPRGEKRGSTSNNTIAGSVNGNAVELIIAPGTETEGRKFSLSHVDGVLKGMRVDRGNRKENEQIFNKVE